MCGKGLKKMTFDFPDLSDREGLFSMLRRRAQDDKLNVRKAAIQTLESAIRFEAPNITKQVLFVFV